MLKLCFSILALILSFFCTFTKPLSAKTAELAHGLHNPRGLIPLANGDLIILEAGTGEKLVGQHSGTISRWSDVDQDRQVDPSERNFYAKTSIPTTSWRFSIMVEMKLLGLGMDC